MQWITETPNECNLPWLCRLRIACVIGYMRLPSPTASDLPSQFAILSDLARASRLLVQPSLKLRERSLLVRPALRDDNLETGVSMSSDTVPSSTLDVQSLGPSLLLVDICLG